jgi:hypothetical protein
MATHYVMFDTSRHESEGVNGIERGIDPPMRAAVTIPFNSWVDNKMKAGRRGALYISISEFDDPITDQEFIGIVNAIVAQLQTREG